MAARTGNRADRAAAFHARRRRPQALADELVVDAPFGGGQRVAGAAPAELDQLGGDRYRGLLRRPGPEVQPDRRPQPGQLGFGQADLAQPGQPVVVGATASHRADVSGRVRSATSSSGTANFGSWVSTQMTVLASTSVAARKRCGQSTTTSSPSGNRDAVANPFRASHTVT